MIQYVLKSILIFMTRLRVDRVKPWNLVRINLVLSLRGPVLILDQVFTIDI